jgi:hypothetical protein
VTLNIPAQLLEKMKGISLEQIRGKGTVNILGFTLEADGNMVTSSDEVKSVSSDNQATYAITLPVGLKANNGCVLKIHLHLIDKEDAAGLILIQ